MRLPQTATPHKSGSKRLRHPRILLADQGIGDIRTSCNTALVRRATLCRTLYDKGTTKKPAVGDEVVLMSISGGSEKESARAKTDSVGHFSVNVADVRGSRLVRVVHQGVTYEKIVGRDANLVAIQVYDVADKMDGVTAIMDVQRFEARSDTLEVKQLVTMHNASKPPRTLMNDRPFSIQLPPEGQVLSGLVQLGDGEPLKSKPAPGERKGEYYFRFPLRPGDTRFAVVYRLLYNGEAVVEPRIRNGQERFVVM